ncbi:MAG: uracil-DNA glycosylase [Pelagimonas sp.]|uniref:uracil-DNA glycosylase n=1 Tax=Pelagimonas sp. TaxID=2073170 RepID=UPI003D6A66A0
MSLFVPAAWSHLAFFSQDLPEIEAKLALDRRDILPPEHQVFAALEASCPDTTRIVILGQDPYPTPGHAHGLSFSVEPDVKLPRSLNNIYKEMIDDLGAAPLTGDLRPWAAQGVLLLNSALTVPAGEANGHQSLGWSKLTEQVLAELSEKPRAFILWGKHAQSFERHISGDHHFILKTAHPSPLSARRGFFGSRPFSKVNAWLKANGDTEVNWTDA